MVRRHSTFFGFTLALSAAAVVGLGSHWSFIWMAIIAAVGAIAFPRWLYGFKDAREPDNEPFLPGSGSLRRPSWDPEPSENDRIADAYYEAHGIGTNRVPDDTELRRLAQGEEFK